MSIIWDRPHGSDIKTINTHIKSIRKRLHEIDESCDPQKLHRNATEVSATVLLNEILQIKYRHQTIYSLLFSQ